MELTGPTGPTHSKWPKEAVRSYRIIGAAVACEGGGGGQGGPGALPYSVVNGRSQSERTGGGGGGGGAAADQHIAIKAPGMDQTNGTPHFFAVEVA